MARELFGQFLIRRGKVRQEDIEEALILQDILRDSLGAVALARDIITFPQVGLILEKMDESEIGFSEAAVELGILTRKQVDDLEEQAGQCQFRLGQLLVATTKLDKQELEEELQVFSYDRQLVPSPNVTKAELVGRIAARTEAPSSRVKIVLESILENITEELAQGGSVVLKGFGTFTTAEYKSREGSNPRSGKKMKIEGRKVPKLRYSRSMRRNVDEGYS